MGTPTRIHTWYMKIMCPHQTLLQKHRELAQIVFLSDIGLSQQFFVWLYASRDLSEKQEKATKI